MTDEGTRTVVAALHRLSDDVAEPPTVLTDAYRRAGQHRRRHRTVLAAVLVLALTAGGAGAQWYANSRPGPNRTADHTAADLLTQPTRGDLAGDAGLRARALAAWRAYPDNVPRLEGMPTYALTGAPSVLLAQHTPAGPVAIVAQRAVPANRTPAPTISGQKVDMFGADQPIVSIGYLTYGTAGTLTVVAPGTARMAAPVPGLAFLAGPDRSWLVVLSEGRPLGLASHRDYQPDGRVTLAFTPIPLNDGVAVSAVPATTDPEALAVAALPVTRFQDGVPIYNLEQPLPPGTVVDATASGKHGLPWRDDLWVLPDDRSAAAAWGLSQSQLRLYGSGWASPAGRIADSWENAIIDATSASPTGVGPDHPGGWHAYGALPDGRGFVVGEMELGNDPGYLYGAIWDHGKRTDLYGGKVDPTAPLPVKLRFPDGDGWLVAAKGAALRYRTGSGGWQAAGTNAALLPAGATQVEVTPAGRQPTVVTLSS